MRKALDLQKYQVISTESLIRLAERLLKNKIFKHKLSFIKQLLGSAIGTKMAPLYAIIFWMNFYWLRHFTSSLVEVYRRNFYAFATW